MADNRPTHPGRTPAERRVLDAMGCGASNHVMHPQVRQRMLDAGLIECVGSEPRRDALGTYDIPVYAMPIPVHMEWCSAVAATDEEMAEFDAEARA